MERRVRGSVVDSWEVKSLCRQRWRCTPTTVPSRWYLMKEALATNRAGGLLSARHL